VRSLGFKSTGEEWVEVIVPAEDVRGSLFPFTIATGLRDAGRKQGVDVRRFGEIHDSLSYWVQGPLVKP